MGFAQKAADLAHKGVVFGLGSLFLFQVYQVGTNAYHGVDGKKEHPQESYLQTLKQKADEAYSTYYKVDHRDWYDKDDQSYLKDAPRANRPRKESS
jgi:hypothetical protein